MPIKVGMNGFGRIGRYMARIMEGNKDVELVCVNARGSNEDLALLLAYDSVHGRYAKHVEPTADGFTIDGREVKVTRNAPGEWNWDGCDIVLETTGKFKDTAAYEGHVKGGAKKVIVSAPADNPHVTIVMGVNDADYDPATHHFLSNASCTTNCLAPVAKVLDDTFGIDYGLMTTVHSYTMSQRILDGTHKDIRRGRAACENMLPTTTGAAKAVGLVLPQLKGKLDGMAVRVPTADGSLVDLTVQVKKKTTVEEVNAALKAAANESMGYTEMPLVSRDYIGDTHGGVVDGLTTAVMGDTMVKLIVWYDNEGGFTNQLLRLTQMVARSM